MKRRTVLASTGGAASAIVAGCISAVRNSAGVVTPSAGTKADLDGNCGPADRPLSEFFTDDPGDPSSCTEPSFAIENERKSEVTVDVALRDGKALSETYTLESGERAVERYAFEPDSALTGTVSVDGTETTVKWPAKSCYRHAIALTEGEVMIGWVEPYMGPGDAEHDCFAGDDAILGVRNDRYWPEELTVSVTNRCDGSEVTEEFSLPLSGGDSVYGLIQNGGVYDITASLADGGSMQDGFTDDCWGVTVVIGEDRDIHIEEIGIA